MVGAIIKINVASADMPMRKRFCPWFSNRVCLSTLVREELFMLALDSFMSATVERTVDLPAFIAE